MTVILKTYRTRYMYVYINYIVIELVENHFPLGGCEIVSVLVYTCIDCRYIVETLVAKETANEKGSKNIYKKKKQQQNKKTHQIIRT